MNGPPKSMTMKRGILVVTATIVGALLLVVLVGFGNAWLQRREVLTYNELPEIAYKAILEDPGLQILALNPQMEQELAGSASFHGYRILGEATCSDLSTREVVAKDLRQRISAWQFTYASCFQPRHGIRAVHSGKNFDFVICFECNEMHFHPPDGDSSYHSFGEFLGPEPLTGILDDSKIPVDMRNEPSGE